MIKLKYFAAADFEQLIAWSGDEAFLMQWSGPEFHYPLTAEQLNVYLQGSNDAEQSGRLIYKAVDTDSGRTVGHISLGGIDRFNRSARIGKVLIGDRNQTGKGYGQQMIRAMLRIGFGELGLHKITLGVFDFNKPAIRCYERCGFVQEGLLRDARRFKDTYWSLVEMGMLESEWDGQ